MTSIVPAYDLTVDGQMAWGDDLSAPGWQRFIADLGAHVGHHATLRFAFRSDSSQYPGVHIDDMIVAEPSAIPLATTTTIPDAFAGVAYSAPLARLGGSTAAVWSITGGTNHGWITIDPTTGTLSGTPATSNVGPVSVTVQEPTVPGNTASATLTFGVYRSVYTQDFEGNCNQNGWTLLADWQCGTPTTVGPASAFSGSKCIATKIGGKYSSNQTFAGTTATSPDISLAGATHPKAVFRMWIDTEGYVFDGANLKISTDAGATWSAVTAVTPPYNLTVSSEPAWGDDLSALGWQAVSADLAAYVGQTVRLRFAFRSGTEQHLPGRVHRRFSWSSTTERARTSDSLRVSSVKEHSMRQQVGHRLAFSALGLAVLASWAGCTATTPSNTFTTSSTMGPGEAAPPTRGAAAPRPRAPAGRGATATSTSTAGGATRSTPSATPRPAPGRAPRPPRSRST